MYRTEPCRNYNLKEMQMDFELVKKMADHPMWDAKVDKDHHYRFPLNTDRDMREIGRVLASEPTALPVREVGPFIVCAESSSHLGPFKWATDFLVPDGTPVLASRDGYVIEVKLASREWGPDESFAGKLNYITIQHETSYHWAEYSQFCHIAAPTAERPAMVRPEMWVKAGQVIGYTGKNGWTDRDHLHFMVFQVDRDPKNPFGFKSLEVSFE